MTGDKELKVKIAGDATQLGAESRRAVNALNEVKTAAQGMLVAFTGGVIGGGIAGAVSSIVQMIANQIASARQLLADARSASIDPNFLSGARWFSERINAPADTVERAIMNARQARQDAAGDDENALASFRRLGLALEEIRDLKPEELFERIAKTFKEGGISRERLVGLAGIIGLGQAQALAPYLAGGAGGDQLDFGKLFRGDFSTAFYQHSSIYQRNIEAMLAGDRYKQNIEPISFAGTGNEERAKRMRDLNDQADLAVVRSKLDIEKQITAVTAERAEIQRRMEAETNSVKFEQLRSDRRLLNQELDRLEKVRDATKSRPTSLYSAPVSADEFAQRGMFIGGQQRVPAILDKQLVELQTLVREMRETKNQQRDIWG
ncbi:MAG: hypothetical protein KF791_08325 [Verrucomicrobiae bacterium]|nr:hypothetical protein [Verrucomicrobiae bacterium]